MTNMEDNEELDPAFNAEEIPSPSDLWNYMEHYWHNNREFPQSTADLIKRKADLVDGKVPSSQLPSYVDDVQEFDSFENLPNPGEKGKIYLTADNSSIFRWTGSEYIQLNSEIDGELVIYSVPNSSGTILTYNSNTKEVSTRTNTEIISDLSLMTTNTQQDVGVKKWFYTSGGSAYQNHSLGVISQDGSYPGIAFYRSGVNVGNVVYTGETFLFLRDDTGTTAIVDARGFVKSGSNDSHLLTGGGGDKPISDFALQSDLNNYLRDRGFWNNAFVAKTDQINSVTQYAGDPSTTGFKSYYGTSLHLRGTDNHWYNRLDFSVYGDRIDLWQGVNVTDMSHRGSIPIIPEGITNWTNENLPDFRTYGLGTFSPQYLIDINTPKPTGFYNYYAGQTTGDSPFGYATILHQAYMNSNEFTQIAIQKGGIGMAFRTENTDWKKVYHEDNFNPDTKVNKSGDTMTGTLSLNQGLILNDTTVPQDWSIYQTTSGINFYVTGGSTQGDVIKFDQDGTITTLLTGSSDLWYTAYQNGLVNRGAAFVSNVDANNLGNQQSAIVSIELGNGTGNTNFPVNDGYGTFMKMSAKSFTSEFFHQNGGELWHRNWYFGGSPSDYPFRKIWDNVNLPNPATQDQLNNYLPLSGGTLTGGGEIQPNGNIIFQQLENGYDAPGIFWKSIDNSEFISGIGSMAENGNFSYSFIGWGALPWVTSHNLAIAENIFTYKGFDVLHKGIFDPNTKVNVGSSNSQVIIDDGSRKPLNQFITSSGSNNLRLNWTGYDLVATVDVTDLVLWSTNNFNPNSKVNAWEYARAIGFSSGSLPTLNGAEYPYIYYDNGLTTAYIALATQDFVNYRLNTKVDRSGDTMTGGLTISTPDSIGSNNLGTLPTNLKLFLSNGAQYGTVFWSEGTGQGYIQQQRADGNPTAYRLNLQPYGGELYYGDSEVAKQTWVNTNFIPKTHPANSITQNYLDGWFSYWGYGDTRVLSPSNVQPTKLQFGFTSWNQNNNSPFADYLHFGGYTDSSGQNQNLIVFNKQTFGLRQYQGTWQSPTSYQSFVDYWNTGHFTLDDISNWGQAYLWGNHASAGYTTQTWVESQDYATNNVVNEKVQQITGEFFDPAPSVYIENKFTTIIRTEEYAGVPIDIDGELIPTGNISIINLSEKPLEILRSGKYIDTVPERTTAEYYITKEQRIIRKGSYRTAELLV